tara:strand:- start:757 stop:1770 length:1014 start_codon:yes stop_codon:yes gene_type:complete
MSEKNLTKPFLTIAYATYNRKNIVLKRLNEVLNIENNNNLEIIFIDNFSSDKTYEELKKNNSNNFIKIYRNEVNKGFSGNFIEVMRKSKGEYTIWVSDEDYVEKKKINEIILFLKKNKPDALVLNHYKKINNSLLPLRINRTKLINYQDLWETCHLPGNIWKKKSVEKIYSVWDEYKKLYPQLTKYYPNLIFMIKLLPCKNVFFFNNFLTFQKDFVKSSHVEKVGYSYSNLIPRWLQHNEIIKLINNSLSKEKNTDKDQILIKLKINLNQNIFTFLSNAIYQENKEVYYHFARSSFPKYILKRNIKFILKSLKFIINSPMNSFKIIVKRLNAFYKAK